MTGPGPAGLFRVACFGDVVGRAGRAAIRKIVRPLRASAGLHFVVVNAENACGGAGVDAETGEELFRYGADVLTSGDHAFQKKGSAEYLARAADRCVRPANFPRGTPGTGAVVKEVAGPDGRTVRVGVMNVLGRTFISRPLDCPFLAADDMLAGPLKGCDVTICDVHAEATSEKVALGRYLDGRVTVVFGTHTHVPTADARVTAAGTAYVTDLGMCGPLDSVIGMDPDAALARFLSGVPPAYKSARGDAVTGGITAEVDLTTGRAVSVVRCDSVVAL